VHFKISLAMIILNEQLQEKYRKNDIIISLLISFTQPDDYMLNCIGRFLGVCQTDDLLPYLH